MTLSKQLSLKGIAKSISVGRDLDPKTVESMDEQKLMQLYELKVEADRWKKSEITK